MLNFSSFVDPFEYRSFNQQCFLDSKGAHALYRTFIKYYSIDSWNRGLCESIVCGEVNINVAEFLDKKDTIVQIDWEQRKHLTQKLKVFGVPTQLIYIGGCEAARRSGTMNRDDLMKLIAAVKSREQCQ
ncbi:MAG: thioredoxin family protein [Deltaproteobacteria bacterium]|nr:thioredoxin family protein [Deltaproteobacteria bacterium]